MVRWKTARFPLETDAQEVDGPRVASSQILPPSGLARSTSPKAAGRPTAGYRRCDYGFAAFPRACNRAWARAACAA